jgi:ABC-type lipopolysaccharide export system ATPase subunit
MMYHARRAQTTKSRAVRVVRLFLPPRKTRSRKLQDRGQTILLVEQNARQALAVSSHAYVIESGKIVLQEPSERLQSDPAIARAYLGQSVNREQ